MLIFWLKSSLKKEVWKDAHHSEDGVLFCVEPDACCHRPLLYTPAAHMSVTSVDGLSSRQATTPSHFPLDLSPVWNKRLTAEGGVRLARKEGGEAIPFQT